MIDQAHPIVLFDGVCNLCNGSVLFILDRDPAAHFRFAALQSDAGRRLLEELGRPLGAGDPESIVLVDAGRVYERSAAALRIARRMRGLWKLLWVLVIVPWPVRDFVYRVVANNRYRWFGRTAECRVPTPELRARFID